MRALLRLVSVLTALLATSGCEAIVPFDENAQPCGVNDECLSGFACKHDAQDAGTCQRVPDGG